MDSPGLLDEAVADAFDGARLRVTVHDGLFDVELHQPGMLRPLRSAELSDGTGSVSLIFMGRHDIPGMEAGRELVVEGRISHVDGERRMYNPWYQLL